MEVVEEDMEVVLEVLHQCPGLEMSEEAEILDSVGETTAVVEVVGKLIFQLQIVI